MPARILLSAALLSLAITALLGGPPWTPLGTIAVAASLLASAGPAP